MNAFFSENELADIGFKFLGRNVSISRKSSIYSPDKISIGSNVRIDDFCLLSGNICIGSYIHIAAYTSLCGGSAGIYIDDFANISRKIEIFAVSDDFSGESMSNPMIPDSYKNIVNAPVHIGRHVIVGSSSVVLPGVSIGEGAVLGALSLAKDNLAEWTINAGIPCRKIRDRSRGLLALHEKFKESEEYVLSPPAINILG